MESSIKATAEDDQLSNDAVAKSRETPREEKDPSEGDSLASTPRKRKRRGGRSKHDRQEMVQSLPTGGTFSQETITLEDSQGDEQIRLKSQKSSQLLDEDVQRASAGDEATTVQSNADVQSVEYDTYPALDAKPGPGVIPPVNGSAIDNGHVPSKFRKDIRSKIPKHPEMRMGEWTASLHRISRVPRLADLHNLLGGQEKSTSLALSRLEGFVQRLTGLNPHDNHPEFGYAQKEVHKAQVDYNYCLYYPVDKEWRPPPSSDKRDMSKAKLLTKPKQWRAALWRLIEKSMKSGRLEQVKDGSLIATEIPLDISDSVESTSHEVNKQVDDDDNELHPTKASQSPDPSLGSLSKSPEQMVINMSNGTMNEMAGNGKYSPADEKAGTTHLNCIDLSSPPEEGEIDDDASSSEYYDAMMDYSSSAGFKKEPTGPQQLDGPINVQWKGPALRDLDPEALNKQLRYFHVGTLSENVDLGLPVKCLACGGAGHDSESCEALTCRSCGAYNKHVKVRCPTKSKCSKCRENGHNELLCPYKLKQISLDEITCDLCQLVGHVEEDCEMMWRTSGPPWVSEIYSNIHIQLSCYECGNQGHLGNDCPTRRPGKGFGSSTWSMARKFDVPLRSEQHHIQESSRPKRRPGGKKGAEMKIRGRAQNQPPPYPPEALPDRNSFLHPKRLPAPARKGKIQINAGTSQRLSEAPRPFSSTPIHRPFEDYGSAQQDHRNMNDQTYVREADFARYNHGNPIYNGDYNSPRRRSRSPSRDAHKRDYRDDRYQPGPPSAQRGYRNQNLYRPMPSAAQNAYSRRRM